MPLYMIEITQFYFVNDVSANIAANGSAKVDESDMESGTVIATMRGGSFIKVRSGSTVATVEMIGDEGELQVGDTVRGNWTSLGGETIWRGSESFDVFIQDYA